MSNRESSDTSSKAIRVIPTAVGYGEASSAARTAEDDQFNTGAVRRQDGSTNLIKAVPLPDVIDSARMMLLYNIAPPPEALATTITRLHRDAAQAMSYGAALFEQLIAVREYLLVDIARDGRAAIQPGATATAGTSKLRTDSDWQQWQQIYTGVASLIAGPAGDSGYAAEIAAAEYAARQGPTSTI